jgi:hypothetical protein
MNKIISKIEQWYRSRSKGFRLSMDLIYHFLMAYSILLIIGSLTLYIGQVSIELFLYSFLFALLMIPVRILTLRYLKKCDQHDYLQQVLSEVLNKDDHRNPPTSSSHDKEDDDDDDWFMKIAKGG